MSVADEFWKWPLKWKFCLIWFDVIKKEKKKEKKNKLEETGIYFLSWLAEKHKFYDNLSPLKANLKCMEM